MRNSFPIEHTLAKRGAARLWELLHSEEYVAALGAMTGNQAMQQVKAGLKAIYVSGWQVAADANESGQMYPDQSLYPVDSVPKLVRRINQTLLRADQIHHAEGDDSIDWMAPLVADGEAGFGGVCHAFELAKALVEAGAAGIHFERPSDQRINAFARTLADAGLTVSVRKSRGRDIRAACGQLIVEGNRKSAGQQAAALL